MAERHLPVRTVYYNRKEVVKTIAAGSSINAVKNCVGYMRTNKYDATHAEVYDTSNGKLYGVVVNKLIRGKHQTVVEYEYEATKAEKKEMNG